MRFAIITIDVKNVFIIDYTQRKKATKSFFLLFTNVSTRNTVKRYQLYKKTIVTKINNICIFYSWFFSLSFNIILSKKYLILRLTVNCDAIIEKNLDYYRNSDTNFYVCTSCYTIFIKKNILKFGSINYVNILFY